tara:strand:+ start:648 stop:1061 length:414 start_codon:yes stop_codon:yes gene_type:complete
MNNIEDKLNSFAAQSGAVPDKDVFIENLHNAIDKREKYYQNLLNSLAGIIVFVLCGTGLFINPGGIEFVDDQTDFLFFVDYDIESIGSGWIVDEEFIYEAAAYLVSEEDLISTGWSIVETLNELNLINEFELPKNGG